MMKRTILLALMAMSSVALFTFSAGGAAALTMKECGAKYKLAQKDGSAKDLKWNDFRKAQCGEDASAEPEVSEAAEEEPEKAAATAPSGVKFPTAVASKYASEKPSKARMHTCVDAYHQNKAAKTLNGLKWIQKGGGYYSLCNAKLKAGA